MKKYFKKISMLLVLSMLIASLAACGKKPAESNATPTPEVTKAPEATQTPEATPTEEPEPTYDFGGRVVRIGAYFDMTPNPESNEFNEAYYNRIKYVEENFNCKIEFVNIGGNYVDQYVTSVLAGNPVVDAGYILSYRLLPALIEGGIAYPVSDLGVIDFSEKKWDKGSTESGTYKGKTYTMGMAGAGAGYGIFYNKTLFERNGLPDLYELYDKGEWTWEAFKDIAIAGNQDTDGDGTIDIYGFNQRENLVWSFMSSNGADAVKKTDTGVELDLDSKEAREALEGYADFMQNVEHMKGWQGDWQSQIWSFRDGTSMMCYEAWWISFGYLRDMENDWGFVPFPMGPSGNQFVTYSKEAAPWMMLNGIEKPEEVAQIINLIFDVYETEEEWDEVFEAILESQANDSKSVEIVMDLMRSPGTVSPLMGFKDLNNLINQMLDEIGNGTITPQTALETYQSALDAAIEDISNYDYDAEMQDVIDRVKEEEAAKEAEEEEKGE